MTKSGFWYFFIELHLLVIFQCLKPNISPWGMSWLISGVDQLKCCCKMTGQNGPGITLIELLRLSYFFNCHLDLWKTTCVVEIWSVMLSLIFTSRLIKDEVNGRMEANDDDDIHMCDICLPLVLWWCYKRVAGQHIHTLTQRSVAHICSRFCAPRTH